MTHRPRHLCRLAAPLVLLAAMSLLPLHGCAGEQRTNWTPPQEFTRPASERIAEAAQLAAQAQKAERDERPDEAIALYQQAAAIYREFPGVWLNLGNLLLNKGDAMQAAVAFRTAADLDPRDPRPVYNLGVLWQRRGYPEDAARYYAEALDRDPNYLPALRYSVMIDRQYLARENEAIERRIRRALLQETDPTWIGFFRRELIRLKDTTLTLPDSPQRSVPQPHMDPPPAPQPLGA